MITVAGFHGGGFLKLEAPHLKKKAAFGLALRTLQADGLVLLGNGKSAQFFADSSDLDQDIPNNIETAVSFSEEETKTSDFN